MAVLKNKILDKETHVNSNCFLLAIICHGNNKGHLLDKNRMKGWVLEDFITDLYVVQTLVGKPKILVVNSCRGGRFTLSHNHIHAHAEQV